MKIGMIYGSSTGNTETAAYQLKDKFNAAGVSDVEIHNIGETSPAQMLSYEYLVLGIPTWNTGELQDDWAIFFPNFDNMDFKGKKVAIFGMGDQNGYGFNFLDAAGILADEILIHGGDLYGYWSTATFDFAESLNIDNGFFMGLGVDNDGQEEMTDARLDKWVARLKEEWGF